MVLHLLTAPPKGIEKGDSEAGAPTTVVAAATTPVKPATGATTAGSIRVVGADRSFPGFGESLHEVRSFAGWAKILTATVGRRIGPGEGCYVASRRRAEEGQEVSVAGCTRRRDGE